MRVAQFTLEYPPAYDGGLGVHVAGLVDYLRRRGDQVDVFCLGAGPAPPGTIGLPGPVPLPRDGRPLDPRRLPGAEAVVARHAAAPYDVAHCHDWHGAPWAGCLWQSGVPLVMTCHLPAVGRFHYARAAGGDAPASEALALRLARRVVAVSAFVAREIERCHRGFGHKVTVVHNGTDPRRFTPGGRPAPARMLAVGRHSAQKGFGELPRVVARVRQRVPEATLRVVGRGPEEAALDEALGRHGVVDAVERVAFVDREGLPAHYREARALVMPSVYEPFGLVAIEAMASGLPVVAYETGGLAEIVTSGADGILVPPGDWRGLADAAATLVADPAQAAELGRRARRTVLERFDQEHCHARTRALYQS